MRFHQLAICSVTLVGVFALTSGAWELTGTAKTENGGTEAVENQSAALTLDSFQATRLSDGRTDVEWRTHETDRLAFRLYREQNGNRERISPVLTSDSIPSGNGQAKTSALGGQSYTWWDRTAPRDGAVSYWLEEVNVQGQRTWHGPLMLIARESRQR